MYATKILFPKKNTITLLICKKQVNSLGESEYKLQHIPKKLYHKISMNKYSYINPLNNIFFNLRLHNVYSMHYQSKHSA